MEKESKTLGEVMNKSKSIVDRMIQENIIQKMNLEKIKDIVLMCEKCNLTYSICYDDKVMNIDFHHSDQGLFYDE